MDRFRSSRVNMSCRVIREDTPDKVQALFATEPRRKPQADFEPWRIGPDQPTALPAEIASLREQVRELEATATRGVTEAREAAFREGEAAGFERAETAGRPVLEKLARAIVDVGSLRGRIREETESDLLTLSIAIARRILRRELTVDPDVIGGLVRAALDKVQTKDVINVRVYPGHHDAIRRCLNSSNVPGIELVSDAALQPGDVVIETKRGNLEASIDTQLAEIERGFADRMKR
jgi:flagellar assembly protein FliH